MHTRRTLAPRPYQVTELDALDAKSAERALFAFGHWNQLRNTKNIVVVDARHYGANTREHHYLSAYVYASGGLIRMLRTTLPI